MRAALVGLCAAVGSAGVSVAADMPVAVEQQVQAAESRWMSTASVDFKYFS